MHVTLCWKESPRWDECINLVKNVYSSNFNANPSPNPSCFAILIDQNLNLESAKILACASLTFNEESKLFSEIYLNQSIQAEMSDLLSKEILKRDLVEIGSLASNTKGAGKELIKLIPMLCWYLGKKFIICTATEQLREILSYCELKFEKIKEIKKETINQSLISNWGAYYDLSPETGYICLESFAKELAKNSQSGIYSKYSLSLMKMDNAKTA